MVEAVKKIFTNYANFSDRTSRRDFWMGILGMFLLNIVVGIVLGLFGKLVVLVSGIYSLALLVPMLANVVRRLHDTNKSGWLACLLLVPIADIIVLVFLCMPAENEGNRFGKVL